MLSEALQTFVTGILWGNYAVYWKPITQSLPNQCMCNTKKLEQTCSHHWDCSESDWCKVFMSQVNLDNVSEADDTSRDCLSSWQLLTSLSFSISILCLLKQAFTTTAHCHNVKSAKNSMQLYLYLRGPVCKGTSPKFYTWCTVLCITKSVKKFLGGIPTKILEPQNFDLNFPNTCPREWCPRGWPSGGNVVGRNALSDLLDNLQVTVSV